MHNFIDLIIRVYIELKMSLVHCTIWHSLVNDAISPDKCQANVLQRILKNNQNTTFGKKYNFSSLFNINDYIKHIPIFEYEDLRPYIEHQIDTGELTIVPNNPVMYARTSGTISKPKYIPILLETINSYKRAQLISSYRQHCAIPEIFKGKVLAIVSPAIEGYMSDGAFYGSMSGLVYQNMPQIIAKKYVLPPALFAIEDYEVKYRLIAAFALCESNISCLATANPSTLIRIIDIIQQHSDSLIQFVVTGDFDALGVKLNSEQINTLTPFVTPNHIRAKYLESLKKKNNLNFSTIWPELRAVVTWTSGNCTILLSKLKKQLSPTTKIIEMGYLASEFRGTITIDCDNDLGIPTIQDNFFEFAKVGTWDNGIHNTLMISQLEMGCQYYIIVTTPHGLYRYFINDIIEVTGKFKNTYTISFVQKGNGVTNIANEKLYEAQVTRAVKLSAVKYNFEPTFYIMLADQENFCYTLYIEIPELICLQEFELKFNNYLSAFNLEYKAKIESRRIKFAGVKILRQGSFDAYKLYCINSGQREGQFKSVHLQYCHNIKFKFEEYVTQ